MASPAAGTSEGRLELLEARVLRLEQALARLSGEALETAAAPFPARPEDREGGREEPLEAEIGPLLPRAGSVLAMLSALGTSFLVLGGAFLIRTITESGAIPTAAGIAIGFAYTLAVISAADRVSRGGRRILAAFLLATAIGIGHPLVYEAVTRFHATGPGAAAAVLVLLAGACLAAAWHRALPAIAWAACLAMAATSFLLASATGVIAPFAAALLAAGVAVEWTPGPAGWRSARWPSALAADALMLWLAAAASTGAPRGGTLAAIALLLALPVLYVGGIAARTFATHREAGPFEVVQSFAAAAIGLGGAAWLIRTAQGSPVAIGAVALVAAVGGYVAALGPLSRAGRPHANASLAGALALALALFGSACVLSGHALAWTWLGFTAAMGAAAAMAGRPELRAHVAAFAWAAAWQSGLAVTALAALLAPRGRPASAFGADALVAIAVAATAFALAVREPARRVPGGSASRVVLAVLAGLGAAGLAVALAAPRVPSATATLPGGGDAALLALLRSAALAATATLYAAIARRTSLRELRALAYAVLVLWGAKLLIEDVPAGRPVTLFAAFALYGVALLWIPKLLRGSFPSRVADPAGGTPLR